jgi:hypothetical protein
MGGLVPFVFAKSIVIVLSFEVLKISEGVVGAVPRGHPFVTL